MTSSGALLDKVAALGRAGNRPGEQRSKSGCDNNLQGIRMVIVCNSGRDEQRAKVRGRHNWRPRHSTNVRELQNFPLGPGSKAATGSTFAAMRKVHNLPADLQKSR